MCMAFWYFADCSACDWRRLTQDRADIAAGLIAGKSVIQPLVNARLSNSPADQLQCARIFARRWPASPNPLWRGEPYHHDKIRVAYISADFRDHATSWLAAGLFEHHDKSRFETLAVSLFADDGSEMRARTRSAFDGFIDAERKTDAEIAGFLRQMEVDIAVDLMGFASGCRPGILALRPAPIQVSYLGYPGTMGASYVDYIIADRIVIPDEHRSFYTEKIAILPDTYQCNDSKRRIAEKTPSRAEAGLPAQGFVFCCFNDTSKITPEIFDVWMRLLKDIAGSVLWLLENNPEATRNLRREAEARAVDGSRLIFAAPHEASRTSRAASLGRSFPGYAPLWRSYDGERFLMGGRSGSHLHGHEFRRARGGKLASCDRNARIDHRLA